MSVIWILTIVIRSNAVGVDVEFQEFFREERCQAAAQQVLEMAREVNLSGERFSDISARCVLK